MGKVLSKVAKNKSSTTKKCTKRALLVGCNYPGSKAQLAGCFNDVQSWKELLTKAFSFEEENVKVLVDVGSDEEPPTGKNIKRELSRIVAESKPGDVVFFQFSGHGVQVPADEDGDYEEDGLDEALCPTDLNLIVDDDLRDILSGLDSQVKFTMISDCCHSGGMLDHEEIVISGKQDVKSKNVAKKKHRGVSVEEVMGDTEFVRDAPSKNRSIDLETLAGMLEETAEPETPLDPKKLRSTLYGVYGKDASHAALAMNPRDLTPDELQHIRYQGPGKKPESSDADPNKGILITGCQSDETSADVTGGDGRSFGALSHAIVKIIGRHKAKYKDEPIANYDLVVKVRQLLNKSGFEQNPCLECSLRNASENFILW